MTSAPIILAIETSQRRGGVALQDGAGRVTTETFDSDTRLDVALIPALDRVYQTARVEPRTTGAIAVSIGPGGFTGLRMAVSTAKMLAEVWQCKLIAVEGAIVAAESFDGEGPIIVALASKRGACWATRLERDGDVWRISQPGRIVDAPTLDLEGVRALLGDENLPSEIRERCAAVSTSITAPVFDPRALVVAGARALAAGNTTDPLSLSPLYPRPPEAVAKWGSRHVS